MVTSWTWLSRSAGAGDADESRLFPEFGEVGGADITHGGAQAAGQLMQHAGGRALVGHLALDAFRHQLQRVAHFGLEIAVGGAARHGADRAHAAIGLVGAALMQIDLARALVGAGEQRRRSSPTRRRRPAPWRGRPEYLMPPSAITGTSAPSAALTTSMMAVSCGTPTPAMMRVVQIEPGRCRP